VAYAVGRMDDDTPAENRSELAFTKAHQDDAAVSQDKAEATALEAQAGTVLESELEAEGGGLIWEVEIDDGTQIHEVTVDAQTGDVLGGEQEGTEGSESMRLRERGRGGGKIVRRRPSSIGLSNLTS
jgi:uncharacterized membrane protein YkoI